MQVPYRLKKSFNKIQQRLVRELEKKFSGKDVILIANRRIMPPQKGASNKRPRSRTLTNVRFPQFLGPHSPRMHDFPILIFFILQIYCSDVPRLYNFDCSCGSTVRPIGKPMEMVAACSSCTYCLCVAQEWFPYGSTDVWCIAGAREDLGGPGVPHRDCRQACEVQTGRLQIPQGIFSILS